LQFRVAIAAESGIAASDQRIIYAGRILKDSESLEELGVLRNKYA
jgi:hypothetical protein